MEKQKQVFYEWDCETVAVGDTGECADGDIIDHAHGATFDEVVAWSKANPPDPGTRHEIVLVRDDPQCRSWAYLNDGRLPEKFENADGASWAKVPLRFHYEVSRSKYA